MYKVMLVDDEPSVCKGLSKIIDWYGCGFQVADTAFNGLDAYEKHMENHFDLIITDLKMPKMGGIELLKKIYASEYPCQVIIVSAYGEFSYAQEAMQYGVDYYLLKPIEETVMEGYLSQIKEKLDAHEKPMSQIPDSEQIENQYRMASNGVVPEIKNYINTHFHEQLSLNSLAVKYSFSPVYLGRIFKQEIGMTYSEYLRNIRINAACDMLRDKEISINDIPGKVGFKDINYFYSQFKRVKKMTPNRYRQEHCSL